MPTTYSDNLPATLAYADRSIFFQPAESSPTPAGVLSISAGRTWTQYAVVRFSADGGRGFHLAKFTPGTDKDEESYAVFCAASGPSGDSCECKGWSFRQNCKHRDACRALIENRWL